ncbi:MAG TPA: DUF262 domain-containing HNH endonuclease family protein [Methylomirabilota bacterium]|nr:DUF262 domain-containing HNH endonuclease family protein [Methylomirabilota bacterium]
MNANAVPVLSIFEKKLRLEVPLFQRQYVWSRDTQWEPLWEDISRKFAEFLNGRKDGPVHFLGAMVLDQKQTPTTHVERRQVIDGQQRLTTLQIFVAAFRDFCRATDCADLAEECDSFIMNKGMMANPDVDRFKVWPTMLDQRYFMDVIACGSREVLQEKYPLVRRKYARTYEPRPRIVEAYFYFSEQLFTFFSGAEGEVALVCADAPIHQRLEECFSALRNALQVVIIDLDHDDDPQVIFETLNARGEPLLPADLLRNFIFLRAARQNENQEKLYDEYWRAFDDEFWREEMRQGRLLRPRSDLFMQHFLASRLAEDIPIKHLYVEYKFWIERFKPFDCVRDELATLATQGRAFHRMLDPQRGDVLFPLASFLKTFDISTAYPLLLCLAESDLTAEDWDRISVILQSYLLRRAICNLTTKSYNRIFLSLIRTLRRDGVSVGALQEFLLNLTGETGEWPTDDVFRAGWKSEPAYENLQHARIVHVLHRLSDTYLDSKSERISIDSPLTVEHILPQDWVENWPLPDGSTGLTYVEIWNAEDRNDARVRMSESRNKLLHTFGNLTIMTQELNSSVSNGPWESKAPALLKASLLPINLQLHDVKTWDESAIEGRSDELFSRALLLWPRSE